MAKNAKLTLHSPIELLLGTIEAAYRVLPVTAQIALEAAAFTDSYPRDPADRQIGGTAIVHGMSLITSDKRIRKSGEVPCIW